jgi:oxygen-independent coproporphyrinogen-3 oxidase
MTASPGDRGPVPGERPPAIEGVYVHVPFCASDCAYCAFSREVAADRRAFDVYLDHLEIEAEWWRRRLGGRIEPRTIYVGGGTPSLLGAGEWARLGAIVDGLIDRRRVVEITVEANPESATPERIADLRRFGMNRLSLGGQSSHPATLELLGRRHAWSHVVDCVRRARLVDGLAVSVDLIYGVPGLHAGAWRDTLAATLDLGIDHLSAYCLSFEEGSSLAARRASGALSDQSDEVQRVAYEALVRAAEAAGLARYEVSNFARAGAECVHNLGYWRGDPYLGLGPSAHGASGGRRFRNHTRRRAWQDALRGGLGPIAGVEQIGPAERAAEILMRLRLVEGVPRALLPAAGGAFGARVEVLANEGLLAGAGDRLRIGRDAFFVGDGIMADLLAAWEQDAFARRFDEALNVT